MEANPGIPLIRIQQDARHRSEHSGAPSDSLRHRYVHRLQELMHEDKDEGARVLNMLLKAGLPMTEGMIFGAEAHREFMEQSGLSRDLRAPTPSTRDEDAASRALRIRLLHGASSMKDELNQEVLEVLIELGAPRVTVVSEGLIRRGLGSIPEVKHAVRDAWLSLEGLKRQVEAAFRGEEVPTWPVLILAESMKE